MKAMRRTGLISTRRSLALATKNKDRTNLPGNRQVFVFVEKCREILLHVELKKELFYDILIAADTK